MAVLGQNKVQSNNSSTQLPSDLRNFRFLMHPTRLAIMRLVHEQFSLPASAIKHELDLSWAECTTHITALETKGYISASSEFVEDKISKIIYLEEMGRKEFEELVISIHNFLDSIEYDFFEKKDMLYPTDSKNQN